MFFHLQEHLFQVHRHSFLVLRSKMRKAIIKA